MLKKLRKYRGKSQEELARATGKTQSAYSRFENAYFMDKLDILMKIASELDVCPYACAAWLIGTHLGHNYDIEDTIDNRNDCDKCPHFGDSCMRNKNKKKV